MECNGHRTTGDNEPGEPLNLPPWILESLCPFKPPHGPWPLLCQSPNMELLPKTDLCFNFYLHPVFVPSDLLQVLVTPCPGNASSIS